MSAILHVGASLAALGLISSVQAQLQQSSVTLGGPASTVSFPGGVTPFTYYSATVPGFPFLRTPVSSGAIVTPTATETYSYTLPTGGAVTTYTRTYYGYYTTIGGTTYSLNEIVPLSVWAPGNYPCPTGFLNRNEQCVFCPAGFYWDRTSCVPSTEPIQCDNGYLVTNSAGSSSCVQSTTITTSTTSTYDASYCPNGYSTYVTGRDTVCLYGTNIEGGGPPEPTLGGPAATTTTAGFTVTLYSAELLPPGANYYTTLTGSPTATITVGGGSTTFPTVVGSLVMVSPYGGTLSLLYSISTYSTVLTTESLGRVTVTQYDSAVLPVPFAIFPTQSSATGNTSSTGIASGSASTVTFASISGGGSSILGVGAAPGTMPTSMATTALASTGASGSSVPASPIATPYQGGAGSGNIDSALAGLSMLGVLLVTMLVIL